MYDFTATHFRFEVQALTPLAFEKYTGSALCGALVGALQRNFCPVRDQADAAHQAIRRMPEWVSNLPGRHGAVKAGSSAEGRGVSLVPGASYASSSEDSIDRKLDATVFAACGWPADLSNEEILVRLLALNLERAGEPAGWMAPRLGRLALEQQFAPGQGRPSALPQGGESITNAVAVPSA